jgi:hypothetical protein
LDTLATCIPLLASSDMYVAIGHVPVLIEIFKHVLAVWNTVHTAARGFNHENVTNNI